MGQPLLKLERVAKSFGSMCALKPISPELSAGDIVGLVGENGAEKSTPIKILSGVYQADAGSIRWKGLPTRSSSPREAIDAGIVTIHQELEYVSHLSVAENMLLGKTWPRTGPAGCRFSNLLSRCGLISGKREKARLNQAFRQ